MKKKILAILICVSIFLNTQTYSINATTIVPNEVLEVLEMEELSTKSIDSCIELLSHSKGSSFKLYVLDTKGYIIYDSINKQVVEYSVEDANPYASVKQDAKLYYFGPVQYYAIIDENVLSIKDDKVITDKDFTVSDFIEEGDKIIDNQRKLSLIDESSQLSNQSSSKSTRSTTSLSGTLRTWGLNSYFCGVDGSAILLMYYDDYYSDSYVSLSHEYNGSLQSYLVNYQYIPNTGTSSAALCSGKYYLGVQYTGLNDYLNDKRLVTDAKRATYSLSNVTTKISNNKPIMIGTGASHPNWQDHWIIVHAVVSTGGGPTYLTVNNGFGSNNINVTSSTYYYDWSVWIE